MSAHCIGRKATLIHADGRKEPVTITGQSNCFYDVGSLHFWRTTGKECKPKRQPATGRTLVLSDDAKV